MIIDGLISFIRLFSFFGMFVFIAKLITAPKKGKAQKPFAVGFVACFCLLVVCGIIKPAERDVDQSIQIDKSSEESKADLPVEYTPIQDLFLSVNKDYTKDDVIKAVDDKGLVYTEVEYTDTVVIRAAWTEDIARQSRAKTGEAIEYHFDGDSGNLEYTEYSSGSFISGLDYNYGYYWDLMFEEPMNEYSGYYVNDLLSGNDGEVITYNNGNQKNTHYYKMETKEEVLNYIITECEKRKEEESP